MYNAFRELCAKVLRIPPEPEPPPGDEAKTQIFRAAPNFYKYLLALWLLKSIGAVVGLGLFFLAPILGLLLDKPRGAPMAFTITFAITALVFIFLVVSRLIALAMVRLDFEQRWYLITDRSLRVREGLILIRESTVTFANIQNISISQGPIQRMLGIADLKVETAGGGGGAKQQQPGAHNLHTVLFRGVDNANAIKELMQQRLKQLKDSGLGDHDDPAPQMQTHAANLDDLLVALQKVHTEAVALRQSATRVA